MQTQHSSPSIGVSLDEVVAHFSKTAPPKRKLLLGVNDGPGTKKKKVAATGGGDDTEDSESDSSSGEETDGGHGQEVEISLCEDVQPAVGKETFMIETIFDCFDYR